VLAISDVASKKVKGGGSTHKSEVGQQVDTTSIESIREERKKTSRQMTQTQTRWDASPLDPTHRIVVPS
jgi:hypothetical protein